MRSQYIFFFNFKENLIYYALKSFQNNGRFMSRDSSDGIVTVRLVGRSRIRCSITDRQGTCFCSPQIGSEAFYAMFTEVRFPELKPPGPEANH
jgi:hypothetical protein